jgi:hypothetical protein
MLGSRHNVRHWGCGAKEPRVSQAEQLVRTSRHASLLNNRALVLLALLYLLRKLSKLEIEENQGNEHGKT